MTWFATLHEYQAPTMATPKMPSMGELQVDPMLRVPQTLGDWMGILHDVPDRPGVEAGVHWEVREV